MKMKRYFQPLDKNPKQKEKNKEKFVEVVMVIGLSQYAISWLIAR